MSGVACVGLVVGTSGEGFTTAVVLSKVTVRAGRLSGILGTSLVAIGSDSGEGDLSGRVVGTAGGVAC